MKILWYSNSPFAQTGYGVQTRHLVTRLAADGHEVAVANNYGVEAAILEYQPGLPIFPKGADIYSSDILPAHFHAWCGQQGGWLITLYDVWPINPQNLAPVPNIASWVPVDHAWVTPEQAKYFTETGAIAIAMSEFGKTELERAGVKDVHYIPHVVDTEVFRPGQTMANGRPPREALKVPDDAYLVIINSANKGKWPPRKAWWENFAALGMFMAAHDDVYVYIHTERAGVAQGVDLERLATVAGLPRERVRWADRYAYMVGAVGEQDMAAIHGAGDVLLLASSGEGFGIPQIESMATGCPVVGSAFSAQPEIIGDTGWLVEGQPWWDEAQVAPFFLPFIGSIADALEASYRDRGNAERRERCRARVLERYDVNRVYAESWRPLVAELEQRLAASPPKPPVNRAERRAKGRRR